MALADNENRLAGKDRQAEAENRKIKWPALTLTFGRAYRADRISCERKTEG
jgi:hypothetical protein